MNPIDWRLSADGYVTGANVHDGSISGFSYRDRTFEVAIDRAEGGAATFRFSGVTKLRADFVDDQVVFAVFAWKIDQAPNFSPEADDNPWRLLAWPSPEQNLERLIAKLSAENPESYLVQISCSYGGDLALICTGIDVFDRAGV